MGAITRHRLLVIDDEPMLLKAFRRMLAADYDVVTVSDPREAVEQITRGEQFALVISDLSMPNMSGMELHARVKKLVPELARTMVFLTGGAHTKEQATFLEKVPNKRLEKPVSAEDLRKVIAELLTV